MWNEKYKNRFLPVGRIGRKDFAKNIFFVVASMLVLLWLIGRAVESNMALAVGGCMFFAFLSWHVFTLLAKRLHDIGLRVWWLFVYVLMLIVLLIFCAFLGGITVFNFLKTICDIALCVVLFAKPGQSIANKFGAPV